MYAMLGDVRFETLQSFASLEAQHSAKFAKHEVLKGRPRLQAMENDLTTLRFGLKLHWMLGNPDTAYKGLLAALEAQQAVSLVYGSGRFVGWFVIESLTERTLIQDSKGRTAARELDVELTEFVGDPNNPLPKQIRRICVPFKACTIGRSPIRRAATKFLPHIKPMPMSG